MNQATVEAVKAVSTSMVVILFALIVIVFIVSYLIGRITKMKGIKELELLKLVYKDLDTEIQSIDWDSFHTTINSCRDEELLAQVKTIHSQMKDVEEVMVTVNTLIHSFDKKKLKNSKVKDIEKVITYIRSIIESQESKIHKLKDNINLITESESQRKHTAVHAIKKTIEVKREPVKEEKKKMDEINNSVESEHSVFAKGLVINGDVSIDTSLIMSGEINGNLTCEEYVELGENAIVNGDVSAASLVVQKSKVVGNIKVVKEVTIGDGAYVKGDVEAEVLTVSGMVEGNISARSEVSLTKDAQVLGNIEAAYIDIERGAKISGSMKTGDDSSNNK